ncbi:MAG: amino acid adenylation domain-containing protein, partial [Chloroflexota bacterium]
MSLPNQSNLTQNQFLLWMGQQINPECPIYNMVHAYRIKGKIDPALLEMAFQKVVASSDALRTVIRLDDHDVPQQFENTNILGDIEFVDFSAETSPEDSYQRWVDKRITYILDLEQQLFDTALVKLAEDYWIWYLNQHHIITDAIATGLVYQATAEYYDLAAAGKLEEAPAQYQYADFVAWEAKHKQTERYAQAVEYWAGKIAAERADVAYYGNYPEDQIGRSERVILQLGSERSAKLREIAAEDSFASLSLDMSMFAIFTTILSTLLHRITGQNDIRIGTPYHGRQSAVFKKTIGAFIEIGLLNISIDPKDTFATLGEKALGETFSNMMQVQPGISTSEINKSFDVILNYINGTSGNFAGHCVKTDWIHTGYGEAGQAFRLQVTDFDQSGELSCAFDLTTSIFGPTERKWLLDHFLLVVDKFLEDYSRPVGSFSLLTDTQHQKLFVDYNNTDTEYPREETVLKYLAEQVRKRPDHVAVTRQDQSITYKELDEKSTALAHQLIELGAKAETTVSLVMHRSIEYIVAIWGVIKSGAAFVPIDVAFPADRRKIMIEESESICVLTTTQELMHEVAADISGCPVILLDHNVLYPVDPTIQLPDPPAPGQLAYIIFTSGSTGRPKGTLLVQQGLMNLIAWGKKAYINNQPLHLPLNGSISFDMSILGIFMTLANGGNLVVYSELDYAPGLETVAIFKEDKVDFVMLTPSHMSLIIDYVGETKRIKTIFCGGEELKTESANQLLQAFGRDDASIQNAYGPTEITVACSIHPFDPDRDTDRSVPLGVPGDNVRMYILDKYNQPVPPGVEGEMFVTSDGTARGYLKRPEKTAAHFLPDPFAPDRRMYRTGDVARWNEQDQLIFTGRTDSQVKIRGVRIELGGLEAIVLSHPDISLAAVDVVHRPDQANSGTGQEKKYLAVWFDARRQILAAELKAWLAERIPGVMIPSFFIQLDEVPLTTGRKINRKALPQPEFTVSSDLVSPRNKSEEKLASIWQSVLGLPQVGIFDNFFDLGGDSIISIQMVAAAKQENIQISPRQLFTYQTIAALAEVVEFNSERTGEQESVMGEAPLLPIQHWFFNHQFASPNQWNQTLWLELPVDIDAAALEEALNHLPNQHDALRARFTHNEGGWHQTFSTSGPAISLHMFEGLNERDFEAKAQEVSAGLDISAGLLMGAALFKRENQPPVMFLAIHHLAIDGVSWRPLLQDLESIYKSNINQLSIQLPAKTSSVKAWGEKLQAIFDNGNLNGEVQFWQSRPAPQTLPLTAEKKTLQTNINHLSTERTEALLTQVNRAYNTEINDILLAAIGLAFNQVLGWDHFDTILEGHGREEEITSGIDLSRTVGWFTSQYPVHLNLEHAQDLGSIIKQTKETVRSIPNHGIGYGILKELGANLTVIEPKIIFNYLGQFERMIPTSPIFKLHRSLQVDFGDNARTHVLEIAGFIENNQFVVEMVYDDGELSTDLIEQLSHTFIKQLGIIVDHCLLQDRTEFTPSDFKLAQLDPTELAIIEKSLGTEAFSNVVDILPLTPSQAGILFHVLRDPDSEIYRQQISFTLEGDFDQALFKQAWDTVAEQHPMLRTRFLWSQLENPVQVVTKQASLGWESYDWRGLSGDEAANKLNALKGEMRQRPLQLTEGPLLSFSVVLLPSGRTTIVWGTHHIVFDGWSTHTLLNQVTTIYDQLARNQTIVKTASRPFSDYIHWLQQQDREAAINHWQTLLDGFSAPNQLPIGDLKPSDQISYGRVSHPLSTALTGSLSQ